MFVTDVDGLLLDVNNAKTLVGEMSTGKARSLIEKGLVGKKIALVGENSYAWVLVYLSVVNINATIVPLDKELLKEGMLELVTRADASVLFYSNNYSNIYCLQIDIDHKILYLT